MKSLFFNRTGFLFLWFWISFSISVPEVLGSTRVPNSTLALPQKLHLSGYALTNAFGDLAFEQPVAIAAPPGETNRLFVVEKSGRIMVITNLANPTKTVFLDLTPGLHSNYIEAGLLGMAFHPGYATNGYFYVYRTLYLSQPPRPNGLYDQLSRFQVSPDYPNKAIAESELPLISQLDYSDTHNAGDVQFGPDGYLYLSLGDEGPSPGELNRTRQPIDQSFFGAILRIDVDMRPGNLPPNPHPASTVNYLVPADNPFIGATNYQGLAVNPDEVRTEIYALGFRNPWRMSFDPITGLLYCGDVGDARIEEVNIVSKGGNYGWPFMEGLEKQALITEAPSQFSSSEPLVTYNHGKGIDQGEAIIGGIVYRGDQIPQLQGNYLFADNVLGHIWAVYYDGTNKPNSFQWLTSDPGVSAFGRDPRDGEALVVNFHHGRIQRLIYVSPEEASPFPQTLAETGAFADLSSLTPNPGILPYKINVPFWSDNAVKSRWFSIPDSNAKMVFNTTGNWVFPKGFVWIKHFELDLTNGVPESRRRIETRFVVKNEDGIYGVTYRWDDSQTNAYLVEAGGATETFQIRDGATVRSQTWRYPSRAECLFCHSAAAGYALGFNTWQLNREDNDFGEIHNQIARWSSMDYFDGAIPNLADLPALANATNTDCSIGFRARSYLAANCSQCHQPKGSYTMAAHWDGRITTRFADTSLAPSLIKPNAPEDSALLNRISTSEYTRMPIVGSTVLDTNAIALVRNWIQSFPQLPWKNQDIGNVGREGDSAILDNTIQVSGSGVGIGGIADQFQFLYQPIRGNAQIIAHLVKTSRATANAGIMFRESVSADSKNAALLARVGNGAIFQNRTETGGETGIASANGSTDAAWLRLVREGEIVTAYESFDGLGWNELASQAMRFSSDIFAGLASSAGNNAALNLASFDRVSLMSVGIRIDDTEFVAPAEVPIIATVVATGNPVVRVEFFVGTEKIGETTQQPFTLTWSNALAGAHDIRVRAIDSTGAAVWSETLTVNIAFPEPAAAHIVLDRSSRGNWQNTFGSDGYLIAAHVTNLPFYAQVGITNDAVIWQDYSTEMRALERADFSGRIGSAWEAPECFTIDLELKYGQFRRVALYFLDWDGNNQRSQKIEVLDANDSILYTRSVANFSNGKYLVLLLRGHVKIRITSTGTGSAVLSGIFFDTEINEPPAVSLISPAGGSSFTLPRNIILEADAADADSAISKVEFFANGTKLGEKTEPPYRFSWTNALIGTYSLMARAIDEFNATASSEPVMITTTSPLANAVFIQSDETTKGNWRNQYGMEGSALADHALDLPAFFSLETNLPRTFTWSGSTDDDRALQHFEADDRIASTWVETDSFLLDFQFRDGINHRVAFYFLDWDNAGRSETITFSDGETGRVLDTRQVTNFFGGKYYIWNLRGHLKMQVTRTSGVNAVFSGIFFDPDTNTPPAIRLTHPLSETTLTAPQQVLVSAEVSSNNPISKVEFFSDHQKIGETGQPPYEFFWQVLAGEHALMAKVITIDGTAADSAPVRVNVDPSSATAQFLGEDSITQGDWKETYGTLGYNIINESENYPFFVTTYTSGNRSFLWIDSTTDVRAPRKASSAGRIAGGWVNDKSFEIDFSMDDGIPRKVSFYCLDWDRGGRQQTFTIRDAATGTILDTRTVTAFQEGKYLSWAFRGRVTVEINATIGNAVLSGLFIDPVFASFELWKWLQFSPEQLANPDISGDVADPDGDGIPNILEYAHGLNPLVADMKSPFQAELAGDAIQLTFYQAIAATDLKFIVETSEDLNDWYPVKEFSDWKEQVNGNIITVRCRLPIEVAAPQFLRLRIHQKN